MVTDSAQVAFVPAVGPLEDRTRLAINWTLGLERTTGLRAGLLTPQVSKQFGPLIEGFKRNHKVTSVKTAGDVGSGPLLVYCAEMEGLVKFGSHRPLVYVAWGSERWLTGWAAQLRAVDITTREVSDAPSADVQELLDDLDASGYKGWSDQSGKRSATRILAEIERHADRPYAIGAMLAAGHFLQSLRILERLTVPKSAPPITPPPEVRRW